MRKLLSVVALLACITPGMAQAVPLPRERPAAATSITDVLQQIVTDATAALADANAQQDTIAATCYAAVIQVANIKIQSQSVQGVGLLTIFQKVRDVTRLNTSPMGTALIVGCAPLVQDAGVSMVDFFTKAGALVLLKGILIP